MSVSSLPHNHVTTTYLTRHLSCTMQYHGVVLNPRLASSPTGTAYFSPVCFDLDIRRASHRTHVADRVVSAHNLARPATLPSSVPAICIISDLLAEDWVITAHNSTDVAIETSLQQCTRYSMHHSSSPNGSVCRRCSVLA